MTFDMVWRLFAIVIIIVIPTIGNAQETYCEKVESRGEGHWPISELAFTKKRYEQALKFLTNAPKNQKLGMDYVSVETELVFIEGYLLKIFITENDNYSKKAFCEFIKNEAYVRH